MSMISTQSFQDKEHHFDNYFLPEWGLKLTLTYIRYNVSLLLKPTLIPVSNYIGEIKYSGMMYLKSAATHLTTKQVNKGWSGLFKQVLYTLVTLHSW